MMYNYSNNDQPFKGDNGPLIGLLTWPDTNNAANWLTPAGTRVRLTSVSGSAEIDNPYFNVNKNKQNAKTNRVITNAGFTPLAVLVGLPQDQPRRGRLHEPDADAAASRERVRRHHERHSRHQRRHHAQPERADACSMSTTSSSARGSPSMGSSATRVQDNKSTVDGSEGTNFLDPNFVSINNTRHASTAARSSRSAGSSARSGRRRSSFRDYLYVNATGRNDWTSTIPPGANSFFYPGLNASFVFTDAFPSLQRYLTGKLRAAVRRSRARRGALLVSHDARVQGDRLRRLRLRLHRTEPAAQAGIREGLRVRRGAELPQRSPRDRRDDLPQADGEPDRPERP